MNLSDLALKRPVTTFMLFVAIVMIGVLSLSRLAIDMLPDIEFPSVTVRTSYEGASPKEVETLITEPIEQAVSTVQNIEEVTSTSSEGSSSVTVSFVWGTDITEAANDIRENLDRVKGRLPDDAGDPTIFKFSSASMPIVFLSLCGDAPQDEMRQYAEDNIKYKLEQIEGVAAVMVHGGLEREIQVDVDRSKMEAVGVTFPEITAALRNENLDEPGGYLKTERTEFLLRTSGQYKSVEQIANTIVGKKNGAPIYLHQIADVRDSFKELRSYRREHGENSVAIMVQKQSGENTVRVAQRVIKQAQSVNETLPPGMELIVSMDSSEFIRDSIAQIQQIAIIGGILAVIILFVFLRNIRSTMIISVALPIAVIATFILMNFAGLTLNMMSLGGVALGIGMLLDNAIVVLENIFRHREAGKSANEAASKGTREVSAAITASTLTTLCVFLPLLFATKGMQGVLFKELAYTVSFALVGSLFVALTLVPVMSAKFLHVNNNLEGRRRSYRFKTAIGKRLDALNEKYRDALSWALSHRLWVMILCPSILVLTLLLVPTLGTELLPKVDEGNISISFEFPVGTRLEITETLARQIESLIRGTVPEMRTMRTSVGSSGGPFSSGSVSHSGSVDINLVDKDKRNRSTDEVMADLRRMLSNIPGARIWIMSRGSIMTMLLGGRADRIEVDIRGYDLEEGARLAEQVKGIVEGVPGTVNVRVSREEGKPELTVLLDRDKTSTLGLDLATVAGSLSTGVSGEVATQYREGGDEYDVRVRFKESDRLALEDVKSFALKSGADSSILLKSIAHIQEDAGPISIERRNQERVITVSAGTADRDFGSIASEISQKLSMLPVPEGFSVEFAGEQQEQQEAFISLILVLLLAIALVYIVMASQFESFLHPFVIMFSIPFAAIGVVLMLFLTGTNISVTSLIGVIMLAGIVVNNAIVLVDYIDLLRREGMEVGEAILEGGKRRLRPILMTTLTTVFALTPMSLGLGAGAELQAPMARTVVGGLTVASLFTLFFIPTLYSLLESAKRRLGRA